MDPAGKNATGILGGQVLALRIHVDLSAEGVLAGDPIGGLTLCHFSNPNRNGLTVNEVLAGANTALGGGPLPLRPASYSELNQLVSNLNQAFDNCTPTVFSHLHLCWQARAPPAADGRRRSVRKRGILAAPRSGAVPTDPAEGRETGPPRRPRPRGTVDSLPRR